jgi:hypothetical protein
MPAFDGTGPRGQGPMTGRGEGYCAIRLPNPGLGRQVPYGYAGRAGAPVRLDLGRGLRSGITPGRGRRRGGQGRRFFRRRR